MNQKVKQKSFLLKPITYPLQLSHGFSLIELLIVLVIVVLMTSIIAISLSSYTKKQALEGGVRTIVSELSDARSRTLSSQGSIQYGVNLQNNRVVLFRGTVYDVSDSANEIIDLDSRVQIETTAVSGGGNSVIFQRLTGETSESGTITVSLISDPTIEKVITIQKTGLVSYN